MKLVLRGLPERPRPPHHEGTIYFPNYAPLAEDLFASYASAAGFFIRFLCATSLLPMPHAEALFASPARRLRYSR